MNKNELVGQSHVFDDGDSITILQIKERDGEQQWVTYYLQQGPGIPRKLVMEAEEFIGTFGHLFGLEDPPIINSD